MSPSALNTEVRSKYWATLAQPLGLRQGGSRHTLERPQIGPLVGAKGAWQGFLPSIRLC